MITKNKKIILRYGENPNQTAYLINNQKNSIFNYQLSGKIISYNNLIDLDSGLKCLAEFNEPTSIIIKHTNPNPIFWFKLKLAWYKYLLNNHIIIAENNAWIGGGINNFIYKFTK